MVVSSDEGSGSPLGRGVELRSLSFEGDGAEQHMIYVGVNVPH